MKTILFLPRLSIFFIVFAMVSCTSVYVPNAYNIPTHTKAGDADISGYLGTCGSDLQASVAISDHLGIMANYSSDLTVLHDDVESYHKHNFVEMGVGYYNVFAENQMVGLYAGFGDGEFESRTQILWGFEHNKTLASRVFIQPSYMYVSDNIDAGIAIRMHALDLTGNPYTGMYYFLEPMALIKVGTPYAKVVFQGGLSLNTQFDSNFLEYRFLVLNCGLQLNVDDIYRAMK